MSGSCKAEPSRKCIDVIYNATKSPPSLEGIYKKCFMKIDILQLFECVNKKIFIVCEVAKDE